jgi:Spy/CpxP family protein refolding chaperone
MRSPLPALFATILSLAIGSLTLADDPKPAGDNPRRERPAGERPQQGEPRPGFGRFGVGFGGPGSVGELMMVLSELNMSPDFTLAKEQKEKIHGIREEFMKQQETWRTAHEEDLKKFQAQFSELRAGGEANREKIQEIAKAQGELYSTAPKGEEQAKEIKALLTPEQAKQLEERLSKRREGGREGRPAGAPGERTRGEAKPEAREPK